MASGEEMMSASPGPQSQGGPPPQPGGPHPSDSHMQQGYPSDNIHMLQRVSVSFGSESLILESSAPSRIGYAAAIAVVGCYGLSAKRSCRVLRSFSLALVVFSFCHWRTRIDRMEIRLGR